MGKSGDSDKVVDLKLIRTLQSEPVLTIDKLEAWEEGGGALLWKGGEVRVWVPDEGADPHRYDSHILEIYLGRAQAWASGFRGEKAKKLARKIRKLMRQISHE